MLLGVLQPANFDVSLAGVRVSVTLVRRPEYAYAPSPCCSNAAAMFCQIRSRSPINLAPVVTNRKNLAAHDVNGDGLI